MGRLLCWMVGGAGALASATAGLVVGAPSGGAEGWRSMSTEHERRPATFFEWLERRMAERRRGGLKITRRSKEGMEDALRIFPDPGDEHAIDALLDTYEEQLNIPVGERAQG
jgi:hypothetical protein